MVDNETKTRARRRSRPGPMRSYLVLIGAVCLPMLALAGYYFMPLPNENGNTLTTTPVTSPSAPTSPAIPEALAARIKAAELDKDRQRYIWDVEHMTFGLETHFGKPLTKAIQAADSKVVAAFLRDDFTGTLPGGDEEVANHGPVTERTRNSSGDPAVRDQFPGRLNEWLAELVEFTHGKLRVLHLNQDVEDKSEWTAEVLLTFKGKTAEGLQLITESHHNIDFRLPSDDFDKEPIVSRWRSISESRRTSSNAFFREVTKEYELDKTPLMDNWAHQKRLSVQYWKQVAVEDFDGDGHLDIAAASNFGFPVLLRSVEGKRFEDVTATMELKKWPVLEHSHFNLAVWIDYDNDSFPDLVLGNRVYHNELGKSFTEVTASSGIKVENAPMGGNVVDYDCDGLLDLYILYQHDDAPKTAGPSPWVGDAHSGAQNQLWRNEGNGRFKNVTSEANAGGGKGHSFAASWHFYDDDRYPDVYIANDFGNNVHLRNRGDGTFEDVSQASRIGDFATSMGVTSGDINNDGKPDFYVANMYSKMGRRIIDHVGEADYPEGIYEQIQGSCAGNRLYMANQSGTYDDYSERYGVNAVGWAYAPSMVDFDGDGWLDLYAATGFLSFDRKKPDG